MYVFLRNLINNFPYVLLEMLESYLSSFAIRPPNFISICFLIRTTPLKNKLPCPFALYGRVFKWFTYDYASTYYDVSTYVYKSSYMLGQQSFIIIIIQQYYMLVSYSLQQNLKHNSVERDSKQTLLVRLYARKEIANRLSQLDCMPGNW